MTGPNPRSSGKSGPPKNGKTWGQGALPFSLSFCLSPLTIALEGLRSDEDDSDSEDQCDHEEIDPRFVLDSCPRSPFVFLLAR